MKLHVLLITLGIVCSYGSFRFGFMEGNTDKAHYRTIANIKIQQCNEVLAGGYDEN